jgi:hypothetical protein
MQFDHSTDVLVVGSGGGALTTALTASLLGADALVVEKTELYGGTSANSGGNVQATGGQLNLTGQLALAGAQGSPGVALALGVGIAAGGDALASAGNVSTHTCCGDPDNFNNFQNVTNNMTTGNAVAVNSVQVGTPAKIDNPDTPDVDESADAAPFTQLNDNTGNAYTLVGADLISFAGAFIVQSNTIEVDPLATRRREQRLQPPGQRTHQRQPALAGGCRRRWAGPSVPGLGSPSAVTPAQSPPTSPTAATARP